MYKEHSELRKGQEFKRTGFLLLLLGQNCRANFSLINIASSAHFPWGEPSLPSILPSSDGVSVLVLIEDKTERKM